MTTEKKTIIYLDQNFISDIAKLSLEKKKDKVNPILKTLFKIIKEGVDEEKFLSPDSWVHAIETAKESNPDLKEAIFKHQAYIGQVSLNPVWEIEDAQFTNALLDYCDVKRNKQDEWRTAFHENPQKRNENYKIDVRMPNFGLSKLTSTCTSVLQQIRTNGIKFEDQYKLEIQAAKAEFKKKVRTEFLWFLRKHNLSFEKADEFIESDKFTQIPKIDIFSKLWSKNLANTQRKPDQLEHDYHDIEFLSHYLPYCDAIATDKYMKDLLQSLNFDKKYNCQFYTMKTEDLNSFVLFLNKEKENKKPANQSLFSVLCVMTNTKPTFSIKFLKKISLAQGKFQGTGKYWNKEIYTSVFLLFTEKNNIEMPEQESVKKLGPQSFTQNQRAELLIFFNGFEKVYNLEQKKYEEVIKTIPTHLRGKATAIINDDSNFDDDLREYDSYLFYDIENAIEKKLEYSKKYNIRIIYS